MSMIITALILSCLGVFVGIIRRAPEGYEDARGYHSGRQISD